MEPAQQVAEEVLTKVPPWIWDGETLPVPVDEVAGSVYGLLVRQLEPDDLVVAAGAPPLTGDQAISGLLIPARGEIWVNAFEARSWPGRRRFTIGHELGHWEMHRARQDQLFCRTGAVEDGERPPLPTIEEEANSFSAALLMPSFLFVREATVCRDDVGVLCARFGASRKAVERRIADLFAREDEPSRD